MFQLKNMISALHTSKDGSTHDFKINDIPFGWKSLVDMKSREDERAENGRAQLVPNLLNSYIIRDPWTKLNVTPSRIMQVCMHFSIQGAAKVWSLLNIFE